ncbi:hypothetical protein [uncultured Aquimarina sp.]|uniref:hypothetical protein n=1 Tax=uncultured Aquimarina sp. TaxID=575652 RepID=UPI002637DABB|nr:hypothetical protein [uncultured Aquimarina sp.]
MKKVLLAAAFIGGTFFSANAEAISLNEDFGPCTYIWESTTYSVTNPASGQTTTYTEWKKVRYCTNIVVAKE